MERNLEKYVTRRYTVLEHSLICESLFKKNTSIPGIYYEEIVDVSQSGLITVYLLKKDLKRNTQWVFEELQKEKEFIEMMVEQGLRATACLEDLPFWTLDKKDLTDDEAIDAIQEMKQKFFNFGGYVEFTHYLGRCNLQENEKNIVLLSDFHDKRKKGIQNFFSFVKLLCKKISEIKKIKHKNLDWLTFDEIELFLRGKITRKKVDALQEKRMKAYIARITPEITEIITDNFKEEFEKIKRRVTREENTEIKGQGINKGTVRGIVLLIDQKGHLSDIQEGRIIVTQMTHPDMTPILAKVKAIVTDEGGILCHAAHVAREFGIIAVIGTKNATKLLKNNDVVEVDAEKGTVTILNEDLE